MAQKGITLIALIITIIILLILAGITIGAVTGENSLINQAEDAKENAEIASEKEAIDNATIEAMGKNKYGDLEENEFQEALDNQTNGKAIVIDIGESFEVFFTESNRYYSVDKNGNIGDFMLAVTDPYPGDITKDEDGNTLTGNSEEDAYQINCIEDLVAFSNMVNGEGKYFENGQLKQISQPISMEKKYIVLTRDLNFKSSASYVDSQRIDFGNINGDDSDGNTLITEMTTGTGFTPIGNPSRQLLGSFNGNNYKISNIYINSSSFAGLFGSINGNGNTIIKNIELTGEIKGQDNSGGIVGFLSDGEVTIENCINRANISGKMMIGGIIGQLNSKGNIINCENYGNIQREIIGTYIAYKGLGGIVGYIGSDVNNIENCKNYGKIENNAEENPNNTGGILGVANSNTLNISNCENFGEVKDTKNNAGGIVGLYRIGEKVRVYNSRNLGNIKGLNSGGIIGNGNLPNYTLVGNCYIENCYNIGKINANDIGGGIVGKIGGDAYKEMKVYINNCYNSANISGKTKGGAVGKVADTNAHQEKVQYLYINNVYYLSIVADKGLGIGEINEGEITEIENINTEEFINLLNNYKDETTQTYPEEWKKWELGEENYPVFAKK